MGRGKLENDLPVVRGRASNNPLMAALIVSALTISGAAIAVLSGQCEEKTAQQKTPKLKVCTPDEKRRVKELLKRGRQATREQAKGILREYDETLEKRLDCGWENVQDAQADLSFRLQP